MIDSTDSTTCKCAGCGCDILRKVCKSRSADFWAVKWRGELWCQTCAAKGIQEIGTGKLTVKGSAR